MSLVHRLTSLAALFEPRPIPADLPAFEPGRRPGPRPVKGVVDARNPQQRTIVVRVDEATFARVAGAAAANEITMSEALRQLIRRGLDASPKLEA